MLRLQWWNAESKFTESENSLVNSLNGTMITQVVYIVTVVVSLFYYHYASLNLTLPNWGVQTAEVAVNLQSLVTRSRRFNLISLILAD